jgi:multidrug resistance protein, MATE family
MRVRAKGARLFAHEVRGLLLLAGPIIVNQLGQVGMSTADTIMVGPLGAAPLAAVGLGSALHHFGLLIAVGTIMGMAPLVSQAFGAADSAACRRIFVQGCWAALLLSVPLGLSLLVGREVSLLLGQDERVAELTGAYMRALVAGIPPALLFVAARQYLEGMGHATAPSVVTFIGLAVNIAANRVLIYGVDGLVEPMGVVGAGWATTTVRWAMLLSIGIFLLTHRALPSLRVSLRPVRDEVARILRVGGPIGAQFGLEVGLFSFAAVMMGWLGAVELAAHQVTINIAATTFMVALGASMAGSIRVGQHIGGLRPRAMRRAVLGTYLVTTTFMLTCALIFVLAPAALIGCTRRTRTSSRWAANCCWLRPRSSFSTARRWRACPYCAVPAKRAGPCSLPPAATGAWACPSRGCSASAAGWARSAYGSGCLPAWRRWRCC